MKIIKLCFGRMISKQYNYFALMSNYKQKIINELKLCQSNKQLSFSDFLYVLNKLLGYDFRWSETNKYVLMNYPHGNIEWTEIEVPQLISIIKQMRETVSKSLPEWRSEETKREIERNSIIEEHKRIKKILKEKGISKEELIDIYLQEIRRNKAIITKSKDAVEVDKYTENVSTLEKRVSLMRNSKVFEAQSPEKLIRPNSQNQKQEKQLQLDEFINNQLLFKSQYFQDMESKERIIKSEEERKALNKKKISLLRKINRIYHHYTKERQQKNQTFDVHNKVSHEMNLTVFLKFCKEFQFSEKAEGNLKETFKSANLAAVFKKYALNRKNLNFEGFLNLITQLLLGKASNFLCETDSFKDHQPKDTVDIQIQQLQKLNGFLQVPRDSKMSNQFNSSTISRKSNQSNRQDGRLSRYIDQSEQDYEESKRLIHQQLKLKRQVNHFRKPSEDSISPATQGKPQSNRALKIIVRNDKGNRSSGQKRSQSSHEIKFLSKGNYESIMEENSDEFSQNEEEQPKLRKFSSERRSLPQLNVSRKSNYSSDFALPKIPKPEMARKEKSIVKSIEFLYRNSGKDIEPKIKKLLNLGDPNQERNEFLAEYFDRQNLRKNEQIKTLLQKKNQEKQIHDRKCPKFNERAYEPFMKFS